MFSVFKKININQGYKDLLESADLNFVYIFMIVMAALLCILGFIMDNETVLIGAMIVSPLLNPIMTFAAAILRKDKKNIIKSFVNLIVGIAIVMGIAMIFSFLWPQSLNESRLIATMQGQPLAYFFVAIICGMTATFCYYWPAISNTVVGIAIAIALVPPLTIFGISLVINEILASVSGIIVLLNIIGVFIGALIMLIFLHKETKWKTNNN